MPSRPQGQRRQPDRLSVTLWCCRNRHQRRRLCARGAGQESDRKNSPMTMRATSRKSEARRKKLPSSCQRICKPSSGRSANKRWRACTALHHFSVMPVVVSAGNNRSLIKNQKAAQWRLFVFRMLNNPNNARSRLGSVYLQQLATSPAPTMPRAPV